MLSVCSGIIGNVCVSGTWSPFSPRLSIFMSELRLHLLTYITSVCVMALWGSLRACELPSVHEIISIVLTTVKKLFPKILFNQLLLIWSLAKSIKCRDICPSEDLFMSERYSPSVTVCFCCQQHLYCIPSSKYCDNLTHQLQFQEQNWSNRWWNLRYQN